VNQQARATPLVIKKFKQFLIRTQDALLYFMIIIVIEQVDQQDRSTQSIDKARDKKKHKKERKSTELFQSTPSN
jgi:hypothetical protein